MHLAKSCIWVSCIHVRAYWPNEQSDPRDCKLVDPLCKIWWMAHDECAMGAWPLVCVTPPRHLGGLGQPRSTKVSQCQGSGQDSTLTPITPTMPLQLWVNFARRQGKIVGVFLGVYYQGGIRTTSWFVNGALYCPRPVHVRDIVSIVKAWF